jgi:hypothetical protein
MKLLLKELPRQILVCHIHIPVLVPRLASITGHVVTEIIYEAGVHWTARSYNSFWIRHSSWVTVLDT